MKAEGRGDTLVVAAVLRGAEQERRRIAASRARCCVPCSPITGCPTTLYI